MKALIIVDMQNDFMPGGALGVAGADKLVPMINDLAKDFPIVVTTQDWHPPNHISFSKWPPHCVADTPGAELKEGLTDRVNFAVHKGTGINDEGYSGMTPELERFLREEGIDEIYIVGVATDYCVYHTALDALNLGFKVCVIEKGCKGIDHEKKALEDMHNKGVKVL